MSSTTRVLSGRTSSRQLAQPESSMERRRLDANPLLDTLKCFSAEEKYRREAKKAELKRHFLRLASVANLVCWCSGS